MDLSVMGLGSDGDRLSWSARALELRDREDLGLFRLAFLEALVRLADWRVSASTESA
jgi:CRISPR-associated endonuclease/helicase Cas3